VLTSFAEPCHVVHVSTASVYDLGGDKRALNELAPTARRHLNAYCETKAAAERLVLARRRAIVLRPHAIYGPGDRVLLPRLLQACRGGRLVAAGNGANLVSLTHVDNLVDAILLALQALPEGSAQGIYNIADDVPVSMDEVLRTVLAATGWRPRVVYLPRALAYAVGAALEFVHAALALRRGPRLTRYRVVQIADDFTLDLTRARRDLGYRPSRDLMSFVDGGGLARSISSRP
jgi:nucleoside-diphosphate-sugar epimerase